VDLDYKGLSNTGTWFIGRLQTERDKARVMEGLEGASDGNFDKQAMERTLAGLGKRRFLLHNVHEESAVVFGTRWVLSYLAGPLTRDHIRTLMGKAKAKLAEAGIGKAKAQPKAAAGAPALPPEIEQFFVPANSEEITYYPRLLGASDILFSSARYKIESERQALFTVEIEDGPVDVDWDASEALAFGIDDLLEEGKESASYAEAPSIAGKAKAYTKWGREFKRWVRQNETVSLFKSARFKLTSTANESEGDFRARLQDSASVARDTAIAKIRKRYASKVNTLENRLMRARQTIEREKEQSTKKKMDTAISFGTAILGAVLGRKRFSSASASKIGTAIKTAGGARKEAADVDRAKETAAKVQSDIDALNKTLEKEIAELDTSFNSQSEELEEITVRAKSTDIHIPLLGLVWMPYAKDSKGRLRPDWL
jgi:hypothetical protein